MNNLLFGQDENGDGQILRTTQNGKIVTLGKLITSTLCGIALLSPTEAGNKYIPAVVVPANQQWHLQFAYVLYVGTMTTLSVRLKITCGGQEIVAHELYGLTSGRRNYFPLPIDLKAGDSFTLGHVNGTAGEYCECGYGISIETLVD